MGYNPLYVERECPDCEEKINVHPVRLKTKKAVSCPSCGTTFETDFDDVENLLGKIGKLLKELS